MNWIPTSINVFKKPCIVSQPVAKKIIDAITIKIAPATISIEFDILFFSSSVNGRFSSIGLGISSPSNTGSPVLGL